MESRGNQDAELHSHGDVHGHGSHASYIAGFLLSVVLTAVPFWLVMSGALPGAAATAMIIAVLAVIQIFVHVRFFLHIDASGEGGWTLVSFIFTAVIVVITIGGSIWAMYQMHSNMMPMDPVDMTQMR
jgi:cytochrome o ubiquinol oxidase subunit IV